MDGDLAGELLPAAKRRRLDVDQAVQQQQQEEETVIPDSDEEEQGTELALEVEVVAGETDTYDAEARADVSLTLLEGDTSLPHAEEDEWDAVYNDLELDEDAMLATDGEAANRQIFSPKLSAQKVLPPQPISSPLKAGALPIDTDAEAREEARLYASPRKSQQQPSSSQQHDDDEEEAIYKAQEAALAAKYGHLDCLNNFNANPAGFTSPAPGGNAGFSSVGFTSVRGKPLAVSEEALARASRLVQFSPENNTGQGDDTRIEVSAQTPVPQRSRSALPFPAPGASSTSREASAPPTVSRLPKPSEGNALQPLRYGPRGGRTLLPSRMPNVASRNTEEQPPQGEDTPTRTTTTSAGFTSGSGKSVVMPSKEQAEKYLADQDKDLGGESMQIDDAPHEPSSSPPLQGYSGLSFAGGAAFKMPSKAMLDQERAKMAAHDAEMSDNISEIAQAQEGGDSISTPAFTGLQSGSGKAVTLPSKEAIEKAVSGLDSAKEQALATTSSGGFTTGSGKAVAQPTEEQIRAAAARLDHPESEAASTAAPTQEILRTTANNGGLTSGGGRPVSAPSEEAMAALNARLNKDSDTVHAQSAKLASTPARPALGSKAVNTLLRSQTRGGTPAPQAPFRSSTPGPAPNKPFKLSVAGRSISAAPSTPARPGNSQGGAALQPRRLNLEMTPRNTPKSALNRSTFKTPFKNGHRPDPKTSEKLKGETNSKMVTPGKNVDVVVASQATATPQRPPTSAAGKTDHKLVKNSVFDLYTKVPRKSMAEYGFNPHVYIGDLIDRRLPTEIIFMTYAKAEAFKFNGEFGFEAAFDDLAYFQDGFSSLTLDWVKNHWTLIVWKTAAMIRAKPNEVVRWWTFQRMIEQLKYRYEREIICGQRSCIRRIQERDSSPWMPMILVVTEIIYEEREIPPEPGSDEARQGIPRFETVAVAIVLSDGWYKIRTSALDDSLYRAICFRSIYPGLKMRIQGAKLDGGSEGAEPMEAFANTTLTISGNGTSRAVWHAKMGFQKRPYICAFSCLLPDGGLVPFIDVIITRLYPLGYKGAYVEGESPDLWDEDEEKVRQRKWDADRENALMEIENEQRQAYTKLAQLHNTVGNYLRAAQKKNDIAKDEDPAFSDFSDVYDKLEEEPDKTGVILKQVSKEVLSDLADFVRRRLEAFGAEGGQGLDKELEARCPPRVAKAFRIVRVKDSRVPDSEARRDCQLNIADVLKLGEDFLVEGKRYLISNVNPGRQSAWSAPNSINGEIFLSTRFDSRWQVLPN